MEALDVLQAVTALIDSLGTIGVLAFAWLQATKRADSLQDEIIKDWQRQNDQLVNPHD